MNHPIFTDALDVARRIADQLADPHQHIPNGSIGRAEQARRSPQSLAGGAAGISLLHIERARTGHGDWATAHRWLTATGADDLTAGPNANLFFGVPAMAFTVALAADHTGTYQRALADLDDSTTAITQRRIRAVHERMNQGARPTLAEFDLIRGLAGFGAYHLHRHPDSDITSAVLSCLVRLTEPLRPDDNGPPWWTETSLSGDISPEFSGGHANIGMSHGIAAPLAVLSLAAINGINVDGQYAAIERICACLDTWQQQGPTGPWWPGYITSEHVNLGHVKPSDRQRPSWCYGTPGVARALQLAAIATGDTARQGTAEHAMLAALRDSDHLDQLTDAGLCHGTAGALQTTWRMASDAQSNDLANELPQLTGRLLKQLPHTTGEPELFDGLAGIALTLHTVTAAGPAPRWDRCMLLA